MDKDNRLNLAEYLLAKFLIYARQQGQVIPSPIPASLLESVSQIQIQPRSPLVSQTKKAKRRSVGRALPWTVTQKKAQAYSQLWMEYNKGGFVTGHTALDLFSRSGIDRMTLAKIWNLADMDKDSQLDATEFKIALHLIANQLKGIEVPEVLPAELLASLRVRVWLNSLTLLGSQATFFTCFTRAYSCFGVSLGARP